jgi:hypothetical protein
MHMDLAAGVCDGLAVQVTDHQCHQGNILQQMKRPRNISRIHKPFYDDVSTSRSRRKIEYEQPAEQP